jgi:hypothetical protein
MTYDPQRNAPRPVRSSSPDLSGGPQTPVDALLDGPDDGSQGDTKAASPTSVSETPPFSVVPEPTAPDADTPKLVVLGTVLSLFSLFAAYRLRRWWLGRGDVQET